MEVVKIGRVVLLLMLLWALFRGNPYGYYVLLRFVCCGFFVYLSLLSTGESKKVWAWIFGFVALIYNPFVPLHFSRSLWEIINLGTVALVLISAWTHPLSRKR